MRLLKMQNNKLYASKAAQRVACPGSHNLEAQFPNYETSSSREGDAAHWLAMKCLRDSHGLPDEELINPVKYVGESAENGEIITREMCDSADLFQRDVIETVGKNSLLYIEHRLDIGYIHPNCVGTPDVYAFSENTLYLWDYKFGYKNVEAYENWQLIEYAAGVLSKHKVIDEGKIVAVFKIVQPRCYYSEPLKEWRITLSDLHGYFTRLKRAEEQASLKQTTCLPNPLCTNCRGRHSCTALQETVLNNLSITDTNVKHELSPHALGNELRLLQHAAKLLDARITGLEQEAISKLQSGNRVAHFLLENSRGRQEWAISVDELRDIGQAFNLNLIKEPDAITPAQALKAGIPEEIIKECSVRKPGTLKLKPVNINDIQQLFGDK